MLTLLLLLPGLASACKTAAPPAPPASPATAAATAPAGALAHGAQELELGPIDPSWVSSGAATTARPDATPRVVLEVRLAPAARLVSDLNVLGRKLPMHLGDLIVDTLAKKSADDVFPINAELLAALAPERAIAVILARVRGAADQGLCMAFPFARPADASATAGKLGAVVSNRGGAIERQSPSGDHLWMGVKDGVLLVSDTHDGLVATCAQALAATQGPPPAEDAVATMDTQALLAARGLNVDLATELGDDLANATDEAAEDSGRKSAAAQPRLSRESMRRLGQQLGQALTETARARLAITASPSDGLLLDATFEPRPDTALARRATAGVPYTLDPALPIDDDRAVLLTWGSLGLLEPLVRAGLPPRAGAGKSMLDEFLATFTGGGSCVLDNQATVSSVCSLPLRAGVEARQALDRYVALMREIARLKPAAAGRRFSPRIKKDILEFDWAIDFSTLRPEQAAMMRAYFGGDFSKYAVAVRGGRLLQFQGPTARARLLAWKDVTPGAPAPTRPPLLAETLARTRGASFMMWLDPLALLLRMLAHTSDPSLRQARIMLSALPGLATTRTPIVVDAPAGPGFTAELRVPMVTFDNVATLVGPFMGLMGR